MKNDHLGWRTLLSIALASCMANAIAADDPQQGNETFFVRTVATYKEGAQVSDSAKTACGLERSIPAAIGKFAEKFKIKVVLLEPGQTEDPSTKVVSLEIGNVTAGRGGSGFGGRWVVSDIGMTASLRNEKGETVTQEFRCSAGLGGNPFANFKACERLQRCSDNLAEKTAKWLMFSMRPPR